MLPCPRLWMECHATRTPLCPACCAWQTGRARASLPSRAQSRPPRAVCARSGHLTAGMDLLGTVVVGTITAVGGGTARDVIVLNRMPFWIEEWEYIVIGVAGALAAFFTWPTLKKMGADDNADVMLMADGVALGAFAVIGTQNGIRAKLPLGLTVIGAMITSTFGGLTRDVLCQRPPRILHAHADIYASTALGGSAAYLAARQLGLPVPARIIAGVSTTAAMRMYAWTNGVRLPTWQGSDIIKN
eukprot:m.58501 g.58501  ORF g.58501 m.58501 type:complete len:244 (-) comp6906_c0_seq2:67-798(-)